jgi:GntR family transcriptional regulator
MYTLSRESPIPLYHQLRQALTTRLKSGEFPPGVPLPTEADLMQVYDVSRITVRRAMRELEQEGRIDRIPGKGTFAIEPKIGRGLTRLTSFTEDMGERGLVAASKLLRFGYEPASSHVASELEIQTGTHVMSIHRLRLAEDQPIALNWSYLRLAPHITLGASELQENGSLWALLEAKGISLVEAKKTLSAILADQGHADLLQVPVGAPLLLVEGVVYDQRHVPVEYSQVINRGDRYNYVLYLKR